MHSFFPQKFHIPRMTLAQTVIEDKEIQNRIEVLMEHLFIYSHAYQKY